MNKKIFLILLILLLIIACVMTARITRRQSYRVNLGEKPNLDNGGKNLEYWSDLRGDNLERHNLSEQFQNLDLSRLDDIIITCTFDSKTSWPAKEKMPPNFDPDKIMDIGKDPGLGIRDLHKQGITGKGVKVAIIDQGLAARHEEYMGKVAKYTNVNYQGDTSLHGPAVASLLAGNKCGTAPGVSLYYWAAGFNNDYGARISVLEDIMKYNKENPKDPIKIVSISLGNIPSAKNFDGWMAKLKEAKESGLVVITANSIFGGAQCPIGRNKNEPNNYDLCYFLQEYRGKLKSEYKPICVPVDNRTFASGFCGTKGYEFEGTGGLSWAEPYLAGVMALGFQVDPGLKEDDIYRYIKNTATEVKKEVKNEKGKVLYTYVIHVINPKGFVDRVKTELESNTQKTK